MNDSSIEIRAAQEIDIPFLIDSIIAAEKSGTRRLSYSTVFGIEEAELREVLADILAEDVTGQELCFSGFLIAYQGSARAGAVCSWVEGVGAKSSTILKGSLLIHFLGRERIMAAAENLKALEELALARTAGALQLESVHVVAAYRGQGISAQLLAAHQVRASRSSLAVSTAQIILAKTNDAARISYERAGFATVRECKSENPRLIELLPAASRIMMERQISRPAQ